jgi:hypothetical protein
MKKLTNKQRSNYVAAINQQDPDLQQVILLLKNTKQSWLSISNRSGVSKTTLRKWTKGQTRRPFNVTLTFVMEAMGYSRRWEKK